GDRRAGDPGVRGARHCLSVPRRRAPGGPGRQVSARPSVSGIRGDQVMDLSRLLFRNPGAKVLAFVIACVTWYILTGERRERISERSYRIPLSIVNIPPRTTILALLPDALDVRIRGSFTALRQLEPAKLEAVIDLLG